MPDKDNRESRNNRGKFRVTQFTRRQVLKSAGFLVAGAAISSISLASACKSSKETTAAPSSSSPSSSPPGSTPAGTPGVSGYSYIPSTLLPPLLTVPGHPCTVADDGRLYSRDHVWVKSLSGGTAVMGITSAMVDILTMPNKCSLSQAGTALVKDDAFGTIEGYKLSTDLITPVSGTMVQINTLDIGYAGLDSQLEPLSSYPYTTGWMVVVQLSDSAELKTLLTAQNYEAFLASGASA
jgi:glycine cleavage system H protein